MKKLALACLMAGFMVVLAACGSNEISSKDIPATAAGTTGSANGYKGGQEITSKTQPAPKDAKVGGQFIVPVTLDSLSPDMMEGWGANVGNDDFISLMVGDTFI